MSAVPRPRARGSLSATVSLILGCAVLLTGCASSSDASESAEATQVSAAEARSIQPPPGVALDARECLVGGWILSGDELRSYLHSHGPGTEIAVTGTLTLGFTLTHYHVEPQVGVVWQSRGKQTLTSLIGDAEGVYQLRDAQLEIDEARNELDFVRVERGERFDVDELFLHPVDVNPLLGAAVRCASDTLTLTSTAAHDADGPTSTVILERSR